MLKLNSIKGGLALMFYSSLYSERLKLIPISIEHLVHFEEIFTQEVFHNMKSTQYVTAAEFLEDKLNQYRQGLILPYVVLSKTDDSVIGYTSLANISIKNKYLENSSTWLGKKYQKFGYNCEIKYTLMKYVFEKLNFFRMNFIVQTENISSLNTFYRLGIQKIGLIKDWIVVHGKSKDGMMFIVRQTEWPEVKIRFEKSLNTRLETQIKTASESMLNLDLLINNPNVSPEYVDSAQ